MARLDLRYATTLLRVAPPGDLVRVVGKRIGRALSRKRPPRTLTRSDVAAAADALARAPKIFTQEPLADFYRAQFPDGMARLRSRAEKILAHELELFGAPVKLGAAIDWNREPVSGRAFDPDARELFPDGVDPKPAWELARAAHLIELGCAGRVLPSLADAAREEVVAELTSFLDATEVGRGIHYASPLELAARGIHWLAAIELVGGAASLPRAFVERVAARMIADGEFLLAHLEDSGVVPANHLLGDWVGLWALGLALDGAPHARTWQTLARRAIEREAARQVGPDGAHFEAATPYHRWALELILVAHLFARAADRELDVLDTLHRMFLFTRGYVGPDGDEPAFGDGDDARLLPIVPRRAREHAYLLSIGAALFGDPELRAPGVEFAEEAAWLFGPRAFDTWRWLPVTPAPRALSFPSGGVHVLRSDRWQVELRAGDYGQHGVGGHAHNDQLAIVAWLDGKPLVVDPGTGRYAADMVLRDHFRGTAAHATLTLDGEEQSPILDGRPFALLDVADGRRRHLEDVGTRAVIAAEHDGYRRLGSRARHRRTVTLHRDLEALVIDDELFGRGDAAVVARFPLVEPARVVPAAEWRGLLDRAAPLGRCDADFVVAIGDPVRAILVTVAAGKPTPLVGDALFSSGYGEVGMRNLVTVSWRPTIPTSVKFMFLSPRGRDR
jgi:hypothetical protein